MRVRHHDGTIPVDGHKGPSQRRRHDGRMDEAWVGVVAEVQERQVEEVEHQEELGPVKVGSDKEHDEAEMEQVVQDEVAANAGGGVNDIAVGREEVADVTCLENEKDDPAYNVSGQPRRRRRGDDAGSLTRKWR
jgi:hypothetical protein